MKLYVIMIFVLMTFQGYAQKGHAKPTIPLKRAIRVNITTVDTTSLKYYNIYYFDFRLKKSGSFILDKRVRRLVKGKITLTFCRNHSIRLNDGVHLSSGGGGLLGYIALKNNEVLNFDEYTKHPALILCK